METYAHMAHMDDSIPLLLYLDRISHGALTPDDPAGVWRSHQLLTGAVPNFVSSFYAFLRGDDGGMMAMEKAVEVLEDELSSHTMDFICGPSLGVVDISLLPFMERIYCGVLGWYRDYHLDHFQLRFPHVNSWYNRCLQLPAVVGTIWTERSQASFETQPFAEGLATREAYFREIYRKYAQGNAKEVNKQLALVRPPRSSMSELEWARALPPL